MWWKTGSDLEKEAGRELYQPSKLDSDLEGK